ncbi:MAG: hypothetical protein AB7N91_30265 [Candidatus Tectimicrobiota bacterium]
MQGKQAKILSPAQEKAILGSLATTRYPTRDRVMLLLSLKAGLRAKAIADLTWAMVTDASGQVGDARFCRKVAFEWIEGMISPLRRSRR